MPADTPLIPQPEATPEALREAVSVLAPERLGEFHRDLSRAEADQRASPGMQPMQVFSAKWSQFAALHRFPERSERMRRLEASLGREADPAKSLEAIRAISDLLAEVDAELNARGARSAQPNTH
ncbi:hypothetical protein [Nocardiopsis chromatogenes]|uniref:hypothetical protein n=1 Tax=Nocardiopsis chromatogenes TaxID=280239 RepID=UPI00034C502E|nr:hypothetical protein [Nocardiopsis chromatogenes]